MATKTFKPLDINLAAVLAILEQENSSHEDKSDAYSQITKHLKDDDLSLFDLDLSKHGYHVVTMAIRDMSDSSLSVNHGALQVLGFCLHDKAIVKSLGIPLQTKSLVALQKCLNKAEDKITCTRALWCLSNQNLGDFIVKGELSKLLKIISKVWNTWIKQSTVVENEAAKAIIRFYQQDPDCMKENLADWGKGMLLSFVHLVPGTGSKLLTIANEVFTRDNIDLWSRTVYDEYKSSIGPELKKMMNDKQEVHALKLWSLYVKILGKELHHGNFINQMLSLVEGGFKSINAEVKIEAFRSWKQLILNFSSDINILSDQKRVKLLMQVFKLNNAKTEAVAVEKFTTWWFFISKLGSKAAMYFDQVCLPLLNFCIGGHPRYGTANGTPRIQSGISPITPHLNLPSPGGSGLPKLEKLQRYAWEVLAQYLGSISSNQESKQIKFQIECPSIDFIANPAAFLKHSTSLITATFDILNLEFTTEPVFQHIWNGLVRHIKVVLDSSIKSDVKEMFTFLLTQFQTLVLSQTVSVLRLLMMFDALCSLPNKALSSTAYNFSNGEKIHGNPALFLMELLLTPSILSKSQRNEKYMTIYNNLTAVGLENGSGYLEFCQSVLELLSRNGEFIKEPDCIWRLWSRLANTLHDQVNKTNEINQGDSLEHNFSCMYNILVFPIKQKITYTVTVPVYKTMVKTWNGLYSTLSRLSALVTTAESNTCCEELCHIILKDVKKDCILNLNGLDFVAEGCIAMVNCIDFGSIGTVGNFNIGGFSPAKWAKKKQKPLENLHSFVQLICYLSEVFAELTEDFISSPQKLKSLTKKIDSGSPNLTSILSAIFETISTLYTHVTSSTFLVKLLEATAESIASLYKLSGGWSGAPFIKKTEKLTESICNSLLKHYTGPYDSDMLKTISPFLEAVLVYPRRSISVIAQNLWTNTFNTGPALDCPPSLSNVFQNMAKKHCLQISIPAWMVRDENLMKDTPCSELTQGDSQAPEPHLPGMPSPNKMRGSLLHKAVSPNVKNSPAKLKEKTSNSAKKKILPADDFQNDVFVVIKSPPPKSNPLTEHQIEIFREKRTMPAMYNTLDASQDVSLMGLFNSGDAQSQLQKTPPFAMPEKVKDVPSKENGNSKQNTTGDQKQTENGNSKRNTTEDQKQTENGNSKQNATGDPKQTEKEQKREPRIHGKINKKKKTSDGDTVPTRQRRSVRFSDEKSDDPISPDSSQKDIAHFNVIKSMMSKIQSPSDVKKENKKQVDRTLIGREDDEIDSAHQLLSLSTPRISPSGKSTPTDSPIKEEEYQPSPSQRKLDSWVIRSPAKGRSKVTEKKELVVSAKKPRGRKSVGSAGDLRSPLKMKGRKSGGETHSPIKRTRRASDSSLKSTKFQKVTEVKEGSNSTKISEKNSVGQKNKDKNQTAPMVPLVEETQSPKKLKQASDDSVFLKPTVKSKEKCNTKGQSSKISPVIAVIEETQSPKKQINNESPTPLLETPPRPGLSDVKAVSGNRKLFSSQDGTETINYCEDSNMIPASPPCTRSVKLGTPVLKLRKLTQDDILQYSPSRKDGKNETSSLTPKRRGRPCKNANFTPSLSDPSSNKSNDKELINFFLHEHDDFSDLKPISREEDIPSSQGFDIPDNSKLDDISKNDSKKETQLNSLSGSESSKKETQLSSLSGSESLFTEQDTENNCDEYNTHLESTLRDPAVKVPKSKSNRLPENDSNENVDNSTPADSTENDSNENVDNSTAADSAETQQKVDPSTYNPLFESTLASPPSVGSARKRKQKTPKKLSPESAGPPKRKRRRQIESNDENLPRATRQKTAHNKDLSEGETESQQGTSSSLQSDINAIDDNLLKNEISFEKSKSSENNESKNALGNDNINLKKSSDLPSGNQSEVTIGHVQLEVNIAKECFDTLNGKNEDITSSVHTDDFMDVDFDESFTKIDNDKNQNTSVNKTPESGNSNKKDMEKTPENRSVHDTPVRVSTTKKKKEVAQKRSLTKGKASIPLDLDVKLESSENIDRKVTGSLDLIPESEIENEISVSDNREKHEKGDIEEINVELNVIPLKRDLGGTSNDDEKMLSNTEECTDSVVIPETNQEEMDDQVSLVKEATNENSKQNNEFKVDLKFGISDSQEIKENSCNEQDVGIAYDEKNVLEQNFTSNSSNNIEGHKITGVEVSAEKGDNSTEKINKSAIPDKGDNSSHSLEDKSGAQKEGNSCHSIKEKCKTGEVDNSNSITEKTSSSESGMAESSSTDFFMAKEAVEISENATNKSEGNNELSVSMSSESDNIPLKDLVPKESSDTSPNSDVENHSIVVEISKVTKRGRPKKNKLEIGKTSPLSQRLRSSGRTLRARGKMIRRSTGDMLSLSKIKRSERKSLETPSLQENDTEKGALTEIDKNIETSEVIIIQSQSQDEVMTDSVFTESDKNSKDGSVQEEIAGPDNLKKFNDLLQDETPRKTPDIVSKRKGLQFSEIHSDSKLVTVPRKFERRTNMARRSILKPSSYSLGSPSQRRFHGDFHPIRIGHVFSPSASPSAGILKRRRLSGEKAVDSPSPPPKQRRVSFAEPLSISKELAETSGRPSSPLVSTTMVSSSLEKIFTMSSESQTTDSNMSKKESQVTQLDSSYASTQQSQLNTSDAVFPDLTACSTSVDKILPQLTSSMWARGLGPLIKARNIHTIGDLSSLTEKQVDELPIRSPKIAVVRKVLKKYEEQQTKQSKSTKTEENKKDDKPQTQTSDILDDIIPDQEIQAILQTGESNMLPGKSETNQENVIEKDNETNSDNTVSGSSIDASAVDDSLKGNSSTDKTGADVTSIDTRADDPSCNIGADNSSCNVVADGASYNTGVDETSYKTGAEDKSCNVVADDKSCNVVADNKLCNVVADDDKPSENKTHIVSMLQSLVDQCSNTGMKELKTQDIFTIHQQLSKLTNTVVDTLKERCHSPSDN